MKRTGDLEQRLSRLLCATVEGRGKRQEPFYQLVRPPADALVHEREETGEAEVVFAIPEGCTCIQWSFRTGLFQFLQADKNADGPFFVIRPDGRIEAHIVECKKTVGIKTWSTVIAQLQGTLYKLLALAGALGIAIDDVVLYTAYRIDSFSRSKPTNPGTIKRRLGPPDEGSPEEVQLEEAQRQPPPWKGASVTLPGFEEPFRHHAIDLDEETGHGACSFMLSA